jgi:GNAT superfamily N-acetyltransferase
MTALDADAIGEALGRWGRDDDLGLLMRRLQRLGTGDLAAWVIMDRCGDAKDSPVAMVVGWIFVDPKTEHPSLRAHGAAEIFDLFVDPVWRRRGLAQALLQKAQEWARHQGFAVIGLCVELGDEFGPAHRLYGAQGFVADGQGIWYRGVPAKTGESIAIGPDATLCLIRGLS